ncbi:MAG: serine/threonine protein kinase [Planctomycetes bacterium]|nr:serine/threonine protein kinase [Planctomycetota bacterium]
MSDNSSHSEARHAREELFWKIAVKNGLLTTAQLDEARAVQLRIEELGVIAKPLSEIILEKEMISQANHDRIFAKIANLATASRIEGYRLFDKLGQGSMGTVFRARQLSLDREVAIKILAPFLQRNERFVTRFLKEAKILARLNHPNIVRCIDVGQSDGQYYLAMEFCDGPTVGEIIKRGGRMAEERATRVILQVARALEHAFESEVIHRDIKPDNIMIIPGGTAKLCDLGLVKDLGTSGDTTDTGSALGTPNYISPEQARGDDHLDHRSDVYSLGATYYHMVTGVTPFENANPAVTMVAHINDIPPTPRDRCPDLTPETSRIITKMMRKHPDDRYQSATAIIRDLEKHHSKLTGGKGDPVLRPRTRRRRR